MSERISDEKLAEIRQSVDIVDLIGDYVQLTKQGRNFFGLCPFHGENTPSFSVSPEKQIYHCFGCGAGGNSFTFLMELEGMTFIEAVYSLAHKGNVELPKANFKANNHSQQSSEANKMVAAHELLKKLYHHILMNTNEGELALNYLLERGFTELSIQKYQLGYALSEWDFALNFLQKRSVEIPLLEKAGLIIERNDQSGYYDRFRDRIIFPIFNSQGKTIAFSGRALKADEQSKYSNSPETIIFNKSRVLYNFNFARSEIRRQNSVILLEGFADVIAADAANIRNCVATMGTAITEEQVALIRRNCSTAIVCFDSDDAGIEASFRVGSLLEQQGCTVKIATMPAGYDPDDYIKEYGGEHFRNEIIGNSATFMNFKLHYYERNKNLQNEGDFFRYIEKVLKEINLLKNSVEREHYLRQLSERFSISMTTLLERLKQIHDQTRRSSRKKSYKAEQSFTPNTQLSVAQLKPAYFRAERNLLAHMLRNDDVVYRVKRLLQSKEFNIDEHQAIFTYLLGFYEEGNEPDCSLFLNYVKDEKLRQIIVEIEMMDINEHLSEQELADYVKQVFNYEKLLKIKEKEAEKREAKLRGDTKREALIAVEIIEIRKTL